MQKRKAEELDRKDEPMEDKKKRRKQRKRRERVLGLPRKIFNVLLILLLCALFVILWVNRQMIVPDRIYEEYKISSAEMKSGNQFPYSIKGDYVEGCNFIAASKNLAVLSDRSFNVLNTSAYSMINAQIGYDKPMLASDGMRFLLYNLGGKEYRVMGISGTLIEEKTDNDIIAADIAENGRYMLVTQADNYASQLTTFLSDGSAQYRFLFSDCRVTSAALNKNGTGAAVCGVRSDGGALVSELYVFDFNDPQPLAVFTYHDDLAMFVEYSKDNVISCVRENSTSVIDASALEGKEYSHGTYQAVAWDACDGVTVLNLAAYYGAPSSAIVALDSSGNVITSFMSDGSVSDVCVKNGVFAVLSEGTVYAYDAMTGESIGSCSVPAGSYDIEIKDKGSVYALSVSSAVCVDF